MKMVFTHLFTSVNLQCDNKGDRASMDPSNGVMGLDAQGNMVFRLVKPVMGIFHHTSPQEQSHNMGQVGCNYTFTQRSGSEFLTVK